MESLIAKVERNQLNRLQQIARLMGRRQEFGIE